MTQNDRVDIQGFGRGHWAAVTDRTLRGAGIPRCVGASSALRRRATMAQAAADVDDLPTYEPAADTDGVRTVCIYTAVYSQTRTARSIYKCYI